MSESQQKKKKRQKFLEEYPSCYFCGGVNPATTIDHVPPKVCFPDGYAPEGFILPACKACNEGTTKQDQIFGLYSMVLDFDESDAKREKNLEKLERLFKGINNNYPEALPKRADPVHQVGSVITPKPVAYTFRTPPALEDAIKVMGAKLAHALYFRDTGKILTPEHEFFSGWYQPQRGETKNLTSYLTSLLPKLTVGERSNIGEYGDRFRYIWGYKEEDFFFYAAQFGQGIILWGIVCGPGIEKPSGGPLSDASNWQSGACGSGAKSHLENEIQ